MFQFKRFAIHQEHAAMKVGTDGCLLGAWANGGQRILDIGTGTALIALMMAQRFPDADIHAIDVDSNAIIDAESNILNSPFSGRITLTHTSLQDYSINDGFNAIVCNPPFFDDSLKNPDASRATARHTDSLPFRTLCEKAYTMLNADGTFSVIIPTEVLRLFSAEACIAGFILSRHCAIKTVPRKDARRHLLEFVKASQAETMHEEHVLCGSDGGRSPWYQELMRDFYL